MTAFRHVLRPCVAASCLLVLSSCSALGLGQVPVPQCRSQADCAILDALDGITPTDCETYRCDVPTGACVLGTRDADGDRDPPPACGGSDCDEMSALRSGSLPETADAIDNDCDLAIDETGLRVADAIPELQGLPPHLAVRYTTTFDVTVGIALLTGDTERGALSIGSFGAIDSAPAPVTYASCPAGDCDFDDVALDASSTGVGLAVLSARGCRRVGFGDVTSNRLALAWLDPGACDASLPELGEPRSAHGASDRAASLVAWNEEAGTARVLLRTDEASVPSAVAGQTTGLGAALAVAALEGDDFAVAFPTTEGLRVRRIDRSDLAASSAGSALDVVIDAGAVSALSLAVGRSRATTSPDLGVTWIEGGVVHFARIAFGGAVALGPVSVLGSGASPDASLAIAYVGSGLVLDGYGRGGETAGASSRGGWLVAWSTGDVVRESRVLELDGLALAPMPSTLFETSADVTSLIFFGATAGSPCAVNLAYESAGDRIESRAVSCPTP